MAPHLGANLMQASISHRVWSSAVRHAQVVVDTCANYAGLLFLYGHFEGMGMS